MGNETDKEGNKEGNKCLYAFRDLLNLTDFSCLEKGKLGWENMHCSLQCS